MNTRLQARPMRTGKFSDDDVRKLREIYSRDPGGFNTRDAAEFYGVSPETIRKICRRDTYFWVKDIVGGTENPFGEKREEVMVMDEGKLSASIAEVQKRLGGVEGVVVNPVDVFLERIRQAPDIENAGAAEAFGSLVAPADEGDSITGDPMEE